MFDCTTPHYDTLYRRWLAREDDLLELAGFVPGMHVLDLCGGTGHIAKQVKAGGGHAVVLDRNPRNVPGVGVTGDANRPQDYFQGEAFDVVVCRQGMGYLDPRQVSEGVSRVLKPGGCFVFNSFHEPGPSSWKRYCFRGESFAEGHIYLGGKVLHLQANLSQYRADVSLFSYHPPELLTQAFEERFVVQVFRKSASLRWRLVLR